MKQLEEGNIKFIKTSGIAYIIFILGMLFFEWASAVNRRPSGGDGGYGSAYEMMMVLAIILIVAVVLVGLNYFFSKPKVGEKFLIFSPILILLNMYVFVSLMIQFYALGSMLINNYTNSNSVFKVLIIIGVIIAVSFLIRYILSQSKWLKTKKFFILLPALIFVFQIVFGRIFQYFFFPLI